MKAGIVSAGHVLNARAGVCIGLESVPSRLLHATQCEGGSDAVDWNEDGISKVYSQQLSDAVEGSQAARMLTGCLIHKYPHPGTAFSGSCGLKASTVT